MIAPTAMRKIDVPIRRHCSCSSSAGRGRRATIRDSAASTLPVRRRSSDGQSTRFVSEGSGVRLPASASLLPASNALRLRAGASRRRRAWLPHAPHRRLAVHRGAGLPGQSCSDGRSRRRSYRTPARLPVDPHQRECEARSPASKAVGSRPADRMLVPLLALNPIRPPA
jgi:hypothetical protein